MKCLRRIPNSISKKIHSYSVVESIFTVISELLHNSIQAESSEVKIIIDLESLSILVSDNGNGFPSYVLKSYQNSKTVEDSDFEGSLRLLSFSCAYLFMNTYRDEEQNYVSIGQLTDDNIFKLYMNHFGLQPQKKGSFVMACRLFSDLPVRARITRQLSKKGFQNKIKELALVSLLLHPQVQVSVSFINEVPFITAGATTSSLNVYNALYPNHNSYAIHLENNDIKIHGFYCSQTRGDIRLQLVLWENVFIQLTKNELKALHDSIKAYNSRVMERSTLNHLNFFVSVDTKSPILELPLRDVNSILSGAKSKVSNPINETSLGPLNNHDIYVKLNRLSIAEAEVISQIANQIVLIRIGNEIFLVDQHACDERVQYEMLFERFIKRAADSDSDLRVKLEKSISFVVSDDDKSLLELFSEFFSSIGISYLYEESLCCITHLPFCMKNCTAADGPSISNSLLTLANRSKPTRLSKSKTWFLQLQFLPSCISTAIALVACRLSIKFGQSLNHLELSYLINNLSNCYFPFHCAHGRPTILPAAKTDLGTFDEDVQL